MTLLQHSLIAALRNQTHSISEVKPVDGIIIRVYSLLRKVLGEQGLGVTHCFILRA